MTGGRHYANRGMLQPDEARARVLMVLRDIDEQRRRRRVRGWWFALGVFAAGLVWVWLEGR